MSRVKTRADVLAFLRTYVADHGYAPSMREIAKAVGLRSPSTVSMHLDTLEADGLICRASGVARSVVLVQEAPA